MKPAQLLPHFDRISESPGAIPRLRRFILDLAFRGRLVEQDPRTEPVSELLKQIQKNKARLINDGVIKDHDVLPPVAENEQPHPIPKGWEWRRFNEVAAIQSNLVNPRDYQDSPHIAPDNIESGTGKLLPYETIATSAVFSSKHLFFAGCILYSKIRPSLAKAVLADFNGLCSADMYPILPLLDRQYLHKYMLSETFVRQSTREDNRVAMPKINQEALSKILVAVPPLTEQCRIVAKVDELMGLCDQLEAAQAERESRRDRLAAASLQRLNQPANGDATSFRENARFHLRHLPPLTRRPEQIPQLRQSIINLAVRGKLTKQMENEEIAAGYLKEPASEELPATWRLLNFGKFCNIQGGNQPPKGKFVAEPMPGYVRLFQIRDLGDKPTPVYIPEYSTNRFCSVGEILIGRYGASVGKVFWAQNGAYNVALAKFVYPNDCFIAQFAFLVIKSNFFQAKLARVTRSAQAGFNKGDLAEIDLPLAPLGEQNRIAAKVEELMALCDRLESQLNTIQTESRRLHEAVLHEALANA